MNSLAFLSIFGASFFTWVILAGYFVVATNLSRGVFIAAHYASSLVAALLMFSILYKFLPTFTPFWTMVVAMISFFIIELIFFSFLYKEELWFLNFVDWMIPVFIISTTIYGLGIYFLN
jgi:hypothetical protein